MHINPLTHAIIGSAIEVHPVFEPGLLDAPYEACLCRELSIKGLLINVNVALLKTGIRRRVLGLKE